MANLQIKNYGNGAVFNIRYTRRMALLSADFSFYNEMNLYDAGMSTVIYFNAFFAAMKKVCSRYNGEFLYIDGDTCVFAFGRYCGINPELTACRCAFDIRKELASVMQELLPAEQVSYMLAIHSADINIAAFSDAGRFRSHVCGTPIAVMQEIMNHASLNANNGDILISESVYQAVVRHAEASRITSVTTRRTPETAVYRLDRLIPFAEEDKSLHCPVSRDIYDTLSALTEHKHSDDRVLVLENASAGLDSGFFDRFYANHHDLFVCHSVCSEYGRNFHYDILSDMYHITEAIMISEDAPESKSLLHYLDYLRQFFHFNPIDYNTTAGYRAALYSFVMVINTLSKFHKVVIAVEHIDLLDQEAIDLLNHLIASTVKSEVYFVFTSDGKLDHLDCRMSSYVPVPALNPTELETFITETVGTDNSEFSAHELTEYIYRITHGAACHSAELLDYLRTHNLPEKSVDRNAVPQDEESLIELRLSGLTDEQQALLNVISLLGSFVEVDFLHYISNNATAIVTALAEKGILRTMMRNRIVCVTFCRAEYGQMIRDNLSDDDRQPLHLKIAEAYRAAYPHNLPKYYEKLAYHYQCADEIDLAVYYMFYTAVNYREQKEYAKARDLLLSAIVLGKEIQDEEEDLHYFTDQYIRVYDYILHQRFGKYKYWMKLSLDVMYYYYAKTFELIDAEASVYLLKAYNMSKKYHNDYITIVSAINYFVFNAYTTKQSHYEFLEEATQLARNNHDVFMELLAQLSYIDTIFAECRDRTVNESMIMSHFFNVKNGMKVGSAFMPLSQDKTIHALYYANYAYYLKHKNADMDRIMYAVHKTESYLTSDIDKVSFYRSIATGFGPLVGTPYQLIYTRKNLDIAKRQKHIPMVAQFKATIGYLYMLEGQYKKALHYHQSAKEISLQTNDIHEVHMAYKNLGDLCNCLERYQEAMKFYRKCLEVPIRYDDSHKQYVDFSDPVFPKSALAFTLIKIGRLDEAEKYIKEVELSMSNIFFSNEVPIFLKFLRCYLSLILEEYDDETIKIMKNCYNDMKQMNPGAVQLVWIKRELIENGILVE